MTAFWCAAPDSQRPDRGPATTGHVCAGNAVKRGPAASALSAGFYPGIAQTPTEYRQEYSSSQRSRPLLPTCGESGPGSDDAGALRIDCEVGKQVLGQQPEKTGFRHRRSGCRPGDRYCLPSLLASRNDGYSRALLRPGDRQFGSSGGNKDGRSTT